MIPQQLEEAVAIAEWVLKVKLPASYSTTLKDGNFKKRGGHKILGLSVTARPEQSAIGATLYLRAARPDLPQSYLAICIEGDRVLCLDLARGNEKDAFLVDVPLDRKEKIVFVADSFASFVKKYEAYERTFRRELNRLRNRKREFEEYAKRRLSRLEKGGKKEETTLSAKPKQWHPRLIRVHDFVIALTAFKYSDYLDALEVDAFCVFDDPRYEPGEPVRGLIVALFGEALHAGGTLDLAFTCDKRETFDGTIPEERWKKDFRRIACPLPETLVRFAQERGVIFSNAARGRIAHREGVALWLKLINLMPEAGKIATTLEEAGYLSREYLAMIISSGVWSREEANWLLINAPRPEAILLGSDRAERRPLFAESLEYGRAAVLGTRFAQAVILGLSEGVDPEEKPTTEYVLEPKRDGWQFHCNQGFMLPWLPWKTAPIRVDSRESVFLLVRPVLPATREADKNWLAAQVELLKRSVDDASHRCLILSMEFEALDWMSEDARRLREENIYLLFAPERLDLYEEEVTKRIARAGRMRQFPERVAPLKLKVLEVPEAVWNSFGMAAMMEGVETMARWIAKKIDASRGRREFTINCRAMERIALQSEQSITLLDLEGEESMKVLSALEREVHGHKITFPFVTVERMKEFRSKLDSTISIKLKAGNTRSGIVVTHEPYERSSSAPLVRSHQKIIGTIVPEDFKVETVGPISDRVGAKVAMQVEKCLRSGEPLAVSYVRHTVLPDTLRQHLHWRMQETKTVARKQVVRRDTFWCCIRALFGFPLYGTKEKVKIGKVKEPPQTVGLRMAYSDGTEGVLFPLYSLESIKPPASEKFYKLKVGLVSMRHRAADGIVSRYLLRNAEMQRCESSAEQEQIAFERTFDFITKMLKALRGKDLEAMQRTDMNFKILAGLLGLENIRAPGLELSLFQSTGLEPVIVGTYRGIVKALAAYRGKLIIIPRILVPTKEKSQTITEDDYRAAKAWY